MTNAREKQFFYSLWALILIGVGIWYFKSQATLRQQPDVSVSFAEELSPIFVKATLHSKDNSLHELKLYVRDSYLNKIRSKSHLKIGYRLQSKGSAEYVGATQCDISPDHPETSVSLINPERLKTHVIHLFLAH